MKLTVDNTMKLATVLVLSSAHSLPSASADAGGLRRHARPSARASGRRDLVVDGRQDLDGGDGQVLEMEQEVPHPSYDASTSDNDFMLVYLRSPADASYDVISPNPSANAPSTGSSVTVMGWGDTDMREEVTKMSDQLMEADVEVISNMDCEASSGYVDGDYSTYEGRITRNMLRAQDFANREDACDGDMGGPLVQGDSLVGVTSGGMGCASTSFPGIYARVSEAYGWMEKEVCQNSRYKPAWCGGAV